MKLMLKLLTVVLLILSLSIFAHGDGHGELKPEQAIEIAQTVAKSLTFKANGMTVGKIDDSWNKVAKNKFQIVEDYELVFVIKAKNDETNQSFYFFIGKDGKVKDVKDVASFTKGHGHSH